MTKKKRPIKKPYSTGNPEIDMAIHELLETTGGSQYGGFLKEIVITALKLRSDEIGHGDIKFINSTLKELRYALKVFQHYRHVRKVAIFGSARTKSSATEYKQAVQFAKKIVKKDWMVITGAADGIMKAGNEGAGRANSFGVNIQLPFEQTANPFIIDDSKLINFKYFFTRKLIFVKESDATVLCPGGFGTHDEAFETLTLIQTGKAAPRPVVCLDPPRSTYWKTWLEFIKKELGRRKLIDKEDLNMLQVTHSAEEAVNMVNDFYFNYHSMRYIRDKLVIRIKRPLERTLLARLNRDFKDILKKGKVEQFSAPFEEEANEPQTIHLTRLAFHFTRHHFSRLYKMISLTNKA